MRNNNPTVDQYWEALASVLPAFTPDERRAALALYRELAKGQPVDVAQLGRALGVNVAEARAWLDRGSLKWLVFPDDQGRIVGFGGLAVEPMHHRFEVDGHTLWTWCAWDALFMPERLGQRARVVSPDPESGQPVELVLTPHEIESVQPEEAVVSFLLPDARELTTATKRDGEVLSLRLVLHVPDIGGPLDGQASRNVSLPRRGRVRARQAG